MKLVIPLFGSSVAPRFDAAHQVLLVTVENEEVIEKRKVLLTIGSLIIRVNQVLDLQPEILICGNIDGFSGRMIASRGVRIIAWVMGESEVVIKAFLTGSLDNWTRVGPGPVCHRWGRGRHGRRRNQRWPQW